MVIYEVYLRNRKEPELIGILPERRKMIRATSDSLDKWLATVFNDIFEINNIFIVRKTI